MPPNRSRWPNPGFLADHVDRPDLSRPSSLAKERDASDRLKSKQNLSHTTSTEFLEYLYYLAVDVLCTESIVNPLQPRSAF